MVRLRLTDGILLDDRAASEVISTAVFDARQREADEFYATVIPAALSPRTRPA